MTRPSVGMEIRLLADVPAAIPALAEWFHAEMDAPSLKLRLSFAIA
jgi:hypothetical protein